MNAAVGRDSRRRTSIRFVLASTVAIGALVAAGVASATDMVQQVVIRDVSLKPQTAAQAEKLYTRIRRAARTVCRDGNERSLRDWRAANACMDDAIARAVASVNSPMLTAMQLEMTGARDVETSLAALDRRDND